MTMMVTHETNCSRRISMYKRTGMQLNSNQRNEAVRQLLSVSPRHSLDVNERLMIGFVAGYVIWSKPKTSRFVSRVLPVRSVDYFGANLLRTYAVRIKTIRKGKCSRRSGLYWVVAIQLTIKYRALLICEYVRIWIMYLVIIWFLCFFVRSATYLE